MPIKVGSTEISGVYVGSTAISRAYVGATQVFNAVSAFDADAEAYITAVETADAQALEPAVKTAINDFVVGCKADGIWAALKASCILAGARTLAGALVPLKGTAPTNFNFVLGDYNRKTGLVGDGTTKYLNSNRNNNADPQNSQHMTVYATATGSPAKGFISTDVGTISGVSHVVYGSNSLLFTRSRSLTGSSSSSLSPGLIGISRDNASSYFTRSNNQNTVISVTSDGVQSGTIYVFRRVIGEVSDARLAFYSIGESLDLAQLDARVTTLINAYGAIP